MDQRGHRQSYDRLTGQSVEEARQGVYEATARIVREDLETEVSEVDLMQ